MGVPHLHFNLIATDLIFSPSAFVLLFSGVFDICFPEITESISFISSSQEECLSFLSFETIFSTRVLQFFETKEFSFIISGSGSYKC